MANFLSWLIVRFAKSIKKVQVPTLLAVRQTCPFGKRIANAPQWGLLIPLDLKKHWCFINKKISGLSELMTLYHTKKSFLFLKYNSSHLL